MLRIYDFGLSRAMHKAVNHSWRPIESPKRLPVLEGNAGQRVCEKSTCARSPRVWKASGISTWNDMIGQE